MVGFRFRAFLAVLCSGGALACAGGLAGTQRSGGVGARATSELRQASYPAAPSHIIRAAPDEPDGTQLLYLDGWRLLQHGQRAELAEQVLVDTLQRSCHSGSGWLHFSRRGNVYWSPTFLGTMKLLGNVGLADLLQCGPEVVTAGWPPLLWTEAGPRQLEYSAPIGRAYFKTRLQGSAWAFPDFWLTTSDGGKTFTRAKAPGAPELLREVPRNLAEVGQADQGRALRAWLERAVWSGAGRVLDGMRLSDGTWVRVAGTQEELLAALHTPDGRITTLTAPSDCRYLAWGSLLLTVCKMRAQVDTVWVDGVYPKVDLPTAPRTLKSLIADAEGRYLFAQSRLEQGDRERVLLRFDGKAWQEFADVNSEPFYARHGWLVLKDPLRVVSAENPEQTAHMLEPDVHSTELDLREHSIVFVQRERTSTGQPELVELDLHTDRVISRTPFPGQPGALALSDTGLAVAIAQNSGAALHMTEGRKFAPLSLQVDPRWGFAEGATCWADGCSVGGVTAWSHVPAEHEPLMIPSEGPVDFEPGEDTTDVGFSIPDYECDTVSPPARPDEELRGLAKGSWRPGEEDDSQAPVAAISAYGGQLDTSSAGDGSFSWRGRDREGAFQVRLPASAARAKLAERLPKHKGDPALLLPVLLARHFALFDDAADAEGRSHLLVVRDSGETEELVPSDGFHFDAVPLPDGRALVSANYPTHRDVMLLDAAGKLSQRRKFLLGVRYSDSLALRGDVPGVVFADDHAPMFYPLLPEAPGVAVTLPKFRKTEPCRTRTPANALTLIFPAMPRLTVAGFPAPARFWLSPTWDSQNGEIAFIETTPEKPCLRGVLLDAPIVTELVSNAPWLHGRMQGQTKSYPLICKAVPQAPPRDSPALELLLTEEEEAKHPRPKEDE